jgi:hypothetical protein
MYEGVTNILAMIFTKENAGNAGIMKRINHLKPNLV